MYDMPKQSQGSEMKGCREKCDRIFCYGQTEGWPVRHLFLWKSQLKSTNYEQTCIFYKIEVGHQEAWRYWHPLSMGQTFSVLSVSLYITDICQKILQK